MSVNLKVQEYHRNDTTELVCASLITTKPPALKSTDGFPPCSVTSPSLPGRGEMKHTVGLTKPAHMHLDQLPSTVSSTGSAAP